MNYWKLRYMSPKERRRVARKIRILRENLRSSIPHQTVDDSIVLGTWNIRNFDDNRFGHGPRLDESLFFIGEIISAFDAIALQEFTTSLHGYNRLKDVVGPDYDYIFTDATAGRSGNDERLGFAFNRRKVSFKGIAGEIVLPQKMLISSENNRLQFSRTPFCAQFQSGWFNFMFATVHIYYGSNSKQSKEYQRRVDEIRAIARFLRKRADSEGINYVLVGDFNIDKPVDDAAFNALKEAGFDVFLNREGSNRKQNKYYDQISFRSKTGEVELATDCCGELEPQGVFDVFDSVFTDDAFALYDDAVRGSINTRLKKLRSELAKTNSKRKQKTLKNSIDKFTEVRRTKANREEYYLTDWRTFQISDHHPLWVTLKIDFTERYLEEVD